MELCPAAAARLPWVTEIIEAFVQHTHFPGCLPRAGGLEDQDALILAGLQILKGEAPHIEALALEEHRAAHG